MKSVWGILAHVDAGKTTLSEAILYNSGQLASLGRVDHGDAFLDTDSQERARGITIFSKPAVFAYEGADITLLDTPGHVDFATEAERAIWALDYAILLISGTDGVQAHTKTIFRLLEKYHVPTVIFINKMDMEGADLQANIQALKAELSDKCTLNNDFESMALSDEQAMEEFLDKDTLSDETVFRLINDRLAFPVFAGAALKNQGVTELLQFMSKLSKSMSRPLELGGRIFKIESLGRDTRLSFMKITGGILKVKSTLSNGEKINELRIYSGLKYTQVEEAVAGDVVALVGPKDTFAGQGIGLEGDRADLTLNPVLSYQLSFLDGTLPRLAYPKIIALNDEDPSLNVNWDSATEQITMNLMGEVQTEILVNKIKAELGYETEFSETGVLYKETVAAPVEGVGHFEPLRHYAEAHVLMEPLPVGSGIKVEADVSTDDLALNWQRLIETHILEKEHLGTSIGAPLTDVKYTIIGGRAHIKHTEGGDFREATYRAIRQGLMEAGTTILEPYYRFEMLLPSDSIGRAMTDIETMSGSFNPPEDIGGKSKLTGIAPASEIKNYSAKLITYTKGEGQMSLVFDAYRPCHNPDDVITVFDYNPDADLDNPSASVFCSHGAATIVPWYEVKDNCHVPCRQDKADFEDEIISTKRMNHNVDEWLDPDEIDKILAMATHSNHDKKPKKGWHYGEGTRVRRIDSDYVYKAPKAIKPKEKYLLVDGYNLIYAWPELKAVLDVNLDGARGKLLDILSNYKAMTDYNVIAVFDAYRVKGHEVTASDYLNIHQVFTAEAQTADAYIERFTHEHGKKYDITVVTSDGLEQVIISGAGARLISSREFILEVERKAQELRDNYNLE
ncbi:small GTP-binding protein domain-containing protein [Pseudobutyrivibrio sp. ACV-2]|uniref:translation factor GTPase family protein n=1 Tax=Pseudobutyrivibrio sp. ACV-2 TaxID=1520801 RepID=UPI00089C5BD9|nr:TetM/TetW/TetO/TetS family tetracycline resistance ribosomal protection protein [Pseudobutyrivibrio sp. ACV-2]SEA58371.1 small GTP-binding protein domain-containing protein [Pseudobutyrivibrio sp. ACV-2]